MQKAKSRDGKTSLILKTYPAGTHIRDIPPVWGAWYAYADPGEPSYDATIDHSNWWGLESGKIFKPVSCWIEDKPELPKEWGEECY